VVFVVVRKIYNLRLQGCGVVALQFAWLEVVFMFYGGLEGILAVLRKIWRVGRNSIVSSDFAKFRFFVYLG